MTSLGEPAVFYLKNMAEMNHLCYPEHWGEPDLTGLDDAEHVQEMARSVGAAACEQVADFLALCGKTIEDHFNRMKIAKLAKRRTRAFVKNYWEWGTRIYVSSVRKGWFSCGATVSAPPVIPITLKKDVCGVVVPWVWSKGGRNAAHAVSIIVRGTKGCPSEWLGNGTVALSSIPIKARPPASFEVDRDQLITEVMKSIARIGPKETRAIANFVAGRKLSDES